MAQIKTKFYTDDSVNDQKARLRNNQFLRGRNAADSGDVNIVKVNASNIPEFGVQPQFSGSNLATESYVNSAVSAFSPTDFKTSCRLVTTSNVTLSGLSAIDGVTPVAGDRILVAGQTTGSDNGIYVAAVGAWARATDADASSEVTSMMLVGVCEGTTWANSFWFLNTADPITLGTTALSFSRLSVLRAKENLTLNGTDITNQYKDLARLASANSVMLSVDGVIQYEGSDYTLSTVGGVTRITFAGDLATGGGAALISGDVLRVMYTY